MLKLIQCFRTVIAICRGRAVVIEDRGKLCRTFVGSEISRNRLNVLMLSQLRSHRA